MRGKTYFFYSIGVAILDVRKLKKETKETFKIGISQKEKSMNSLRDFAIDLFAENFEPTKSEKTLPEHIQLEIKIKRSQNFIPMHDIFKIIDTEQFFDYWRHDYCKDLLDINQHLHYRNNDIVVNEQLPRRDILMHPELEQICAQMPTKGNERFWEMPGVTGFFLIPQSGMFCFINFPGPGGHVSSNYVSYREEPVIKKGLSFVVPFFLNHDNCSERTKEQLIEKALRSGRINRLSSVWLPYLESTSQETLELFGATLKLTPNLWKIMNRNNAAYDIITTMVAQQASLMQPNSFHTWARQRRNTTESMDRKHAYRY